jgi:hypothetical protein
VDPIAAGFGFTDLRDTIESLAIVGMLAGAAAVAFFGIKGNLSKGLKIGGTVMVAAFLIWFINDISSADPFFGRIFDQIDN